MTFSASTKQPIKPMSGLTLALTTISLSLAVFMQILDSTIANVALPTIAGDLGAATSQGTWVITMFAAANAISIPLTGWLSRRFGQVRVFLVSTVAFVFCSWLCGISQSLIMLIICRVAQGAVAGPLIPLAQSLLLQIYPPQKRAVALGIFGMVVVTAPVVGPILGGYICDNFHWGWIFFINVPVGIFAVLVSALQLRGKETPTASAKVDVIGLVLLVVGVGSLQIMLDQGRDLDWFHSTEIIVLTTLSFVALSYLVVWEWFHKHPIVDLRLFLDINFSVGTLAISLAFMVYMGALVLLPLLLQQEYHYTALWAGLATAPIGVFPVLLMPLIGKFGYKVDTRLLVSISFVIFCCTFIWRSHFAPITDFWGVVWPQLVQGIGVALFFMPLTQITLSRMDAEHMASATGLTNFVRTMFGAIGASTINTLWERRSIVHHEQLAEHINAYSPQAQQWLAQAQQSGMTEAQAHVLINQQITQQASLIGSNEVFFVCGLLFLGLIFIVWFARAPFHNAP